MQDFTSIRLKARKFSTVTVTDPNIIGEDGKPSPITFQIRRLLQPEEDRAKNNADEYNAKYITGGFRDAGDNWCEEPLSYMPFVDLLVPDESGATPEMPELGYGLLSRCAALEEMQPANQRYSMDQLLVMSVVAPDAYSELAFKALRIQQGVGEPNSGNASKDSSEKPDSS